MASNILMAWLNYDLVMRLDFVKEKAESMTASILLVDCVLLEEELVLELSFPMVFVMIC